MEHLKRSKIQMFIDNELSNEDYKIVETHLAECKECKSVETDIRKKILFLKNVIAESGVERIPEMEFVPEIQKDNIRKKQYIRLPVPVFAAMIAGILIMGMILLFQNISLEGKDGIKKGRLVVNYVKLETNNKEQIIPLTLDLSGYELLEKPIIKIIRRVKNENI